MKRLLSIAALAAVLTLSTGRAGAQELRPKSVIHVINVKWKKEATKEQIKAALDGLEALHKSYPGMKRVWTNTFKLQLDGFSQVIVMEFESRESLDKYTGSEAQKNWYKLYLPIREESRTNDITN
ncbi:MAG: hypothetical protein FJW39_14535 [Acidobacteria bacterium]|nr:hypothetical protein [Acidobacteriota bacterium]